MKKTILVDDRLIRDYEWELIRSFGKGTYAKIASEDPEGRDVELVIEEYCEPKHREIWDNMSDDECIELAYKDILERI